MNEREKAHLSAINGYNYTYLAVTIIPRLLFHLRQRKEYSHGPVSGHKTTTKGHVVGLNLWCSHVYRF